MLLTRRAALNALVAGGVGSLTGLGAYELAYARHNIEIARASVPVSGLPPALDGLRIGLMTDVHHSAMVPLEDVVHAADVLMSEQPDLIALGGDFVTWSERRYMTPCSEALAGLNARYGVFAAMGNHDDERDMPAALRARGFEVLRDARTRILLRGEALEIAGLRFWTRTPIDVAYALRGSQGPVILIAHDPRRLFEAAGLNVGLVLSGHTHGGQVVLPVVGAVAARKFPVAAGIGRQDNTSIFVSRGVGTVYIPFRYHCPPDVAVLTLRSDI